MSNFSYLSTRPEYSLSGDVRGGVPEGVGAGGEVGVCGRQDHHDALQGQPAIPST